MHTHPFEPHRTLNCALSSVARILDGVILGAGASPDLKTELIALLDTIMQKFAARTLRYYNNGSTYEIHRDQGQGDDITVHGIIRIDLSTFVCTYFTNTGVTLLDGPRDDNGSISFVENGTISQKNIDLVLKKIGINASSIDSSCCIS